MSLTKQDTLRVPGAHLAYEVRGEGPLLLMIAGGGGEGGGFTGIADHLAEQYTVVTYDRRGAGRSTLDDPQADMSVQMHSNDAHTLLAALTTEPALVFGSSAGALIGLDLVVRYPQQVRLLVAHEPAAPGDLACFRSGPGAPSGDLSAIRRYQLDLAALASVLSKIVLASGSAGQAFLPSQCTVALAERLGTDVVAFPSHHTGYITHPRAFAERLREELGAEPGK